MKDKIKDKKLKRIKRDKIISLKLNVIEYTQIKAFAEANETSISDYIRRKLLEPGY